MWTELNRRCDTDAQEEADLFLNEAVVFTAELTGELDGETLYFSSCWAPFMPEIYTFEVTRESLFDYLVDLDLDDEGNLVRIRSEAVFRTEADEEYDGAYSEQFYTLMNMIERKAAEVGYRTETYDDSDDLDDM